MICPHCSQNVLQRERTGRVCGKCRRAFAFDPKTDALRLSDLRVRKLSQKLTAEGQITVTVGQLWGALARKAMWSGNGRAGALGCLVPGLSLGSVLLAIGASSGGVPALAAVGAGLIGLSLLVAVPMFVAGRRAKVPVTVGVFRGRTMSRWLQVYDALPPGVVDDSGPPAVTQPSGPQAALLCQDHGVATFLAANDVPRRYGVFLATDPGQLPPGVPVVVLHDADPAGCRLASRVRASLPGRRVVDAGLPPRAAMNNKRALAVRGPAPAQETVQGLRESGGLTALELTWLAKGWSAPLLGLPPRKLLTAVTRVLERVTAPADRRRAEAVGFLTWPGEEDR
ncbi:hypothetical protein [Streptomyces sp. NPDC088725]|uniref:hypothetical protein n=1 Tax=Streptomyces sp. NPDC088725 TaxID=3365873 RepID=UPI0037F4C664